MIPVRFTTVRAAKLYLRRRTHPRTSRRVYWLRRVGRVVERVERAASGRSPWWEALNPHGAGPQDYTVSLFFFLSTSLLSSFLSRSLPFHLTLFLTLSFASLDIIFNLLCIFDTCGPSRRKSGRREYTTSTGCRFSFRGKIKTKKNMKNEWGREKKDREKGREDDMVVEEVRGSDGGETNRIGSVPLEGELSRYCRSGSSPLDKTSRSKRPPFWCSTGWRAEERELEIERADLTSRSLCQRWGSEEKARRWQRWRRRCQWRVKGSNWMQSCELVLACFLTNCRRTGRHSLKRSIVREIVR